MKRMLRSPSLATSSVVSDDETDKSFSDTEGFVHRRPEVEDRNHKEDSESGNGWELDYIEESKITIDEETDRVERCYKLKFKGYEDSEWQPEDNVDALELVRCFWENIGAGSEVCIQEQQKLLVEIENRSDSDQEDITKDRSTTDDNKGYNEKSRKDQRFKQHKQLKPRANSEIVESDSDSDSDEEPLLTYSIPSALTTYQSDLNNPFEHIYKPRTLKMRRQIKNHLAGTSTSNPSDITCTSSSLLGAIDLDSIYSYKPKNSEIAKQIEKLIVEIKLDTLRIKELRNKEHVMKNKTRQKPRIVWKIGQENLTKNSVTEVVDSTVPSLRQEREDENAPIQNHSEDQKIEIKRNQDLPREKNLDHENTLELSERNCTTSPNSFDRSRSLTEVQRNLYHVRSSIPNPSTPKSAPSVGLLNSSPQPTVTATATSSTQQPSEDEDDQSICNTILNPRIKRKRTDMNNMKYHTFNEIKRNCRPRLPVKQPR